MLRRSPTASARAAPRDRTRLPRRSSSRRAAKRPGAQRARLHEPRARLRRRAGRRQDHAARGAPAQHRDRLVVQRHAVGAPAVRALSRRSSSGAAREAGATAQFAGGVPAMCDGVTQGEPGMELSLFSRDVIAHGDRGRALAQHVRRRAVPRHLRQDRAGPADRRAAVRPPADRSSCRAGRCRRGLPNNEKARVRQLLREGQGRPRRTARIGGEVVPRRPAPARSTAPPTATRC